MRVLALVLLCLLGACHHLSQDTFGYEKSSEGTLNTPEYGPIHVTIWYQFSTMEETHSPDEVAIVIYDTMKTWEHTHGALNQNSLRYFQDLTIYVVDDQSSLWQDYCGDKPDDFYRVYACSHPYEYWAENFDIAIADRDFNDQHSYNSFAHESIHALQWFENGIIDRDHTSLDWNLVDQATNEARMDLE